MSPSTRHRPKKRGKTGPKISARDLCWKDFAGSGEAAADRAARRERRDHARFDEGVPWPRCHRFESSQRGSVGPIPVCLSFLGHASFLSRAGTPGFPVRSRPASDVCRALDRLPANWRNHEISPERTGHNPDCRRDGSVPRPNFPLSQAADCDSSFRLKGVSWPDGPSTNLSSTFPSSRKGAPNI